MLKRMREKFSLIWEWLKSLFKRNKDDEDIEI